MLAGPRGFVAGNSSFTKHGKIGGDKAVSEFMKLVDAAAMFAALIFIFVGGFAHRSLKRLRKTTPQGSSWEDWKAFNERRPIQLKVPNMRRWRLAEQ